MESMESKRRSAFMAREGIQTFLESLDKHLQRIAIARIVGGVLASTGAFYMLHGYCLFFHLHNTCYQSYTHLYRFPSWAGRIPSSETTRVVTVADRHHGQSVGVYSTAQEIGVQLVSLGSLISAVAMGFRLRLNGRASDLLDGFHDVLPSTSGVLPSLGNGVRNWSLIRLFLCGLACVDFFTTKHELGWTVFLSLALLALLALNGVKVFSLIRGFQGKTSSQTSKALRQCLQELDKALYCQTP